MTSTANILEVQENFRLKEKQASKFYSMLNKEQARKVSYLVGQNQKLFSTQSGKDFKVAGVSLYPAFKGSCSHAHSCKKTCIAFTGRQRMAGSDNFRLSIIDKAQLKRLWLYKNDNAYFNARVKNEIEKISEFGEYKIFLREINSETLDMNLFKSNSVITYNYFKNPEKIFKPVSDLQIYSWNELSNKSQLLACISENIPVSVVVPKLTMHTFLNLSNEKVKFHNGDSSDLESLENYEVGKLNIHLLSEKKARYSKEIGRTDFLESYKELFKLIGEL